MRAIQSVNVKGTKDGGLEQALCLFLSPRESQMLMESIDYDLDYAGDNTRYHFLQALRSELHVASLTSGNPGNTTSQTRSATPCIPYTEA